jgi:glycosyltransferase involved in cell wall biosynthesis
MNILLITEYFPPENHIASMRLYSFAKYWHRAGHNITVLTTLKNRDKNDLNLDLTSFKVIRLVIPFYLFIPNKKYIIRRIINKALSPARTLFNLFKNKTGCFATHFPNFCDLWAKRVLKLVDARDYDIVLSSGGPYSVHRVGLALKKKNKKIKWVVDWRDLWTKDPDVHGLRIFNSYEVSLEKEFHENADLITTVADPLNKTLTEITSTTVKTIYHGFDLDDFNEIKMKEREASNVCNIVFTGSLYRKNQDLSPLFEAVSRIKKKDIALFNKIKIQFAGPNADVIDIVKKYDISDSYCYLGHIRREESLRLQYNANMVLFLDFININGMLPGKLFEYIHTSRKIIAIGDDANSSAAELIKKTNAGVYLGSNIDLIEQYLIDSINNPNEKIYIKNDAIIQEFTRESQAKKLLNYILQLDETYGTNKTSF